MHPSAWMVWLAVALALAAVETVTVDLIFLMLAAGALAGSVASLFGAPVVLAGAVAAVTAIAGIAFVRPAAKRAMTRSNEGASNVFGASALMGRAGTVTQRIDAGHGQILIDGETWSARSADSEPIDQGSDVRVVNVSGASLVVTPLPHPYA